MKVKPTKITALILIGVIMMAFLFGCFAKKYEVTSDDSFMKGVGEYREGSEVRLVMDIWATDTNYSFYVDGEPADVTFDYNEGYIITFKMPGHDVHVTYDMDNTMTYEGDGYIED